MRNRNIVIADGTAAYRRPARSGPGGVRHSGKAQAGGRRAPEPVRPHLWASRVAGPAREARSRVDPLERHRQGENTAHQSLNGDPWARVSLVPRFGRRRSSCRPRSPAVVGQAQDRFRAGIDLVSLNVAVTEGARYVTDLEVGDFEVFEDGIKQEVSFFSKVQQPIALAVLLDTSASMESKLETAQEAAIGFARRIRPGDVMEVVDFDSQVNILQPFTGDVAALERAIRQATRQRFDLALQRHLHRLEEPAESACPRRSPSCGARPSSCSRTVTIRRAWSPTTRCSISPNGPKRSSMPSDCGKTTSPGAISRRRSSCCGSCRRRLVAASSIPAPSRSCRKSTTDCPGARQPVFDWLHLQEPAAQWRVAAAHRPA